MPQLRDSGTRSLHATEPVPSAEMDGFCRISASNRIRRGGHRCRTPRGRRPGGDDHVPAHRLPFPLHQHVSGQWLTSVSGRRIPPRIRHRRSARSARGPGPGPRRRTRDAQPSPEGPAQAARILRRTRHDPCVQKQRRLRRPRLRLPRKLPGPPLRAVGDHRTPAAAVPHHPPAVHRCRPP